MLVQTLQHYFGFSDFRPGQREIVERIMAGHDVVALMPTGGGKSLCYQLPALLSSKLTIVISPLIALMKDQVDALRARGIAAAYVNSSLVPTETAHIMRETEQGKIKVLYVAPERFSHHLFHAWLLCLPVGLIAIDEAHCISAWGHDFRPEYLDIRDRIGAFYHRPVVAAFTATATRDVRDDIVHRLGLRDPHIFVRGFNRSNLQFFVREGLKIKERQAEALRLVQSLSGVGIVYALTRKEAEEMAALFVSQGISAVAYHAGLLSHDRSMIQQQFQQNQYKVIVATVAFGMGVDKADIRFVIHLGMPASLEAYYQEAGRAGRDGVLAYCILLHSRRDVVLHHHFLKETVRAMGAQKKTTADMNRVYDAKYRQIDSVVRYTTMPQCRRKMILEYFSDPAADNFGNTCESCDVCLKYVWPDVARYASSPVFATKNTQKIA